MFAHQNVFWIFRRQPTDLSLLEFIYTIIMRLHRNVSRCQSELPLWTYCDAIFRTVDDNAIA